MVKNSLILHSKVHARHKMGPSTPTKEDPACEAGEGPDHKEAQSGSKHVVALRSLR